MEIAAAQKLLNDLIQQKALIKPGVIRNQLPNLFIPGILQDQVFLKSSWLGRVMSVRHHFNETEKKLAKIFSDALAAAPPVSDRVLIQLARELDDKRVDKTSALAKLPSSELQVLEEIRCKQLQSLTDKVQKYSQIGKSSGLNKKVDYGLFQEIFGLKDPSLEARKYWLSFLKKYPDLKSKDFGKIQLQIAAARRRTEFIKKQLYSGIHESDIHECEKIIKHEGKYYEKLIAHLEIGSSLIFEGCCGIKPNSIKSIYRLIHSLPNYYTEMIPELFRKKELYENPREFIHKELHKFLVKWFESIVPEQKHSLKWLAEDPEHKNFIDQFDALLSYLPSPAVLELMHLLAYTPGISSHIITAIFYHLFGLMKLMPHDRTLEFLQWVRDNITRLSHKETIEEALDDLEKRLLNLFIDQPLDDFQRFLCGQIEIAAGYISKNAMSPVMTQWTLETYALDTSLQSSHYWLQIEKQDDSNYCVYIYASGHALSYFQNESGKVQWPMRISNVPPNRLNHSLFERLLSHQFRPEFDINFISRAEDIFSENGVLATLKTKNRKMGGLEWRPLKRIFDSSWQLYIMATSTGDPTKAALKLHYHALLDFCRPYSKNGLDFGSEFEISATLEKGIVILQRELDDFKNELSLKEREEIECTIYDVKDACKACLAKQTVEKVDEALLPPQIAGWIKNTFDSLGITTKQIADSENIINFAFGQDVGDALKLILKSLDAAPIRSHEKVMEGAIKKIGRRLKVFPHYRSHELQHVLKKCINDKRYSKELYRLCQQIEGGLKDILRSSTIIRKIDDLSETKSLAAARGHLTAFFKLIDAEAAPRLKELDLARILLKQSECYLSKLADSLRTLAVELHDINIIKIECLKLQKHDMLNKLHISCSSLLSQIEKRTGKTEAYKIAKNAVKVMDDAVTTPKALKNANQNLSKIESELKTKKLPVAEIAQIRNLMAQRERIEKSFAPKKGFLESIYVQTLFYLIEILLAISKWMSLTSLPWFYEAAIGVLPESVGSQVDYVCKKIVSSIFNLIYSTIIKLLVRLGKIDAAYFDKIDSIKLYISSIAASFTGKRRISLAIPKPDISEVHAKNLDQRVKPLLLAFSRFANPNKIQYTTKIADKNPIIESVKFKEYNLEFITKEVNGSLKATSKEFGKYSIAESQENPIFIRYGSYLLLENPNGKRKILLPSGGDFKAAMGQYVSRLGPLSGLLGNLMVRQNESCTLPLRFKPGHYYVYDIDHENRLVSDNAEALAYLIVIELIQNRIENTEHATGQLLERLRQKGEIKSIHDIEMMLWPLTTIPAFLKNAFFRKVVRVRRQLFAALQKRINSTKSATANEWVGASIASAVYSDLLDNAAKREYGPGYCAENDEEDWHLFSSYERHGPHLRSMLRHYNSMNEPWRSTINKLTIFLEPIGTELMMTPVLGKRYRELESKFIGPQLKRRAIHLIRDMALAEQFVPIRAPIQAQDAFYCPANLLGNFEILGQEEPQFNLPMQIAQAWRVCYTIMSPRKIDYNLLQKMVFKKLVKNVSLSPEVFSHEHFIRHFISYYGIARGEEGDKRRINLLTMLQMNKGGWDATSAILIDCLINIASPPVVFNLMPQIVTKNSDVAHRIYALSFYPRSAALIKAFHGNEQTLLNCIKLIICKSRDIEYYRKMARPYLDLVIWLLKGPILGLIGGRTPYYSWWKEPLYFIGSRLAYALFNDNTSAPMKKPNLDPAAFWHLRWEEDSKIDKVLKSIYSSFSENQSLLMLYRNLNGQKNALQQSIDQDKKVLLNLVNSQNMWLSNQPDLTYKQIVHCFFLGDFSSIGDIAKLELGGLKVLEQTILRLLARESRMDQFTDVLKHIFKISKASCDSEKDILLQKIPRILTKKRLYHGDNPKDNTRTRLLLCWEIGHQQLLNGKSLARVSHNIKKPNYVSKLISKAISRY